MKKCVLFNLENKFDEWLNLLCYFLETVQLQLERKRLRIQEKKKITMKVSWNALLKGL